MLEQLIFKLLYFRGEILGRDLASALGLKFSLIEDMIEGLKRQQLVQVKRSLGMGSSSASFALAEPGRAIARQHLEANQYSGPAPVPLYQYTYFVRKQRRSEGWLAREALEQAYRGMVLTPHIFSQIGPAVSSGNSFLIYGQPGNGKTSLLKHCATWTTLRFTFHMPSSAKATLCRCSIRFITIPLTTQPSRSRSPSNLNMTGAG
jgi:hypothetical protein